MRNDEQIMFSMFLLVFTCLSRQTSGDKPVDNLAKNLAKCPIVLDPKCEVCETLSSEFPRFSESDVPKRYMHRTCCIL